MSVIYSPILELRSRRALPARATWLRHYCFMSELYKDKRDSKETPLPLLAGEWGGWHRCKSHKSPSGQIPRDPWPINQLIGSDMSDGFKEGCNGLAAEAFLGN